MPDEPLVALFRSSRELRNALRLAGCRPFVAKAVNLEQLHHAGRLPRLAVVDTAKGAEAQSVAVVASVSKTFPLLDVVVWATQASGELVRDLFHAGAKDVVVEAGVNAVVESAAAILENQQFLPRIDTSAAAPAKNSRFESLWSRNPAMWDLFELCDRIAASDATVLIVGETGTGKELIARAIHRIGGRSGKLVAVNVSGLDDSMFSDTLFGHTRGAFTGADTARGGMIEQAAGGTLFLDEIGDLGNASQVKLLRLLQEGEYYPVGSDVSRRMNAGVVVATHQDLAACISSGQFRKDLYYRLCSHHVHIPPLRERRDDIPLLLDHFLGEAADKLNRKRPAIPRELPVLLKNYDFPGNVRELRSLVFDAVSRHQAHILSMDTFRAVIARRYGAPVPAAESAAGQNRSVFIASEPLPRLHDVAGLLVSEAMRRAEGNQSIASRLIGVSQPALSKRLRKMGQEHEPITVERL